MMHICVWLNSDGISGKTQPWRGCVKRHCTPRFTVPVPLSFNLLFKYNVLSLGVDLCSFIPYLPVWYLVRAGNILFYWLNCCFVFL